MNILNTFVRLGFALGNGEEMSGVKECFHIIQPILNRTSAEDLD